MKTYKLILFYAPGSPLNCETIKTGLTLKQAQAHCRRKDTREEGKWFDGYDEETSTNLEVENLLRLGKYAEAIGMIKESQP